MKRIGNIFQEIASLENLIAADGKAQKGKSKQYGVVLHKRNQEQNIMKLHDMLISKIYKTSEYNVFKVYEPKEREIFRLPYYPDRIVHHAIMNVLEPVFVAVFTADSYSCIKGRGIHKASFNLRKVLNKTEQTTYCLKLDIKKFYPSINHDILKSLLRKKFKDNDLLWLLDEIIDSAPGLPIGNYLSQYLANFYLTYFDHWIKEQLGVKYYFRYADDIVILHHDKAYLRWLFEQIENYLYYCLKLEVKGNWQIFPVEKRGIDFVGYVHYHTHVRLRKSIKKRFAKMLKRRPRRESIASYIGWTKHCNSKNLLKKLLPDAQF
ncbi:MAG: reverse transcriptase [Chryseobacterium sp. SCN 40-13]|nr:MAG: reverse transcriptase [Chryseobacterium sp. SCN 40-13]